MSLRRTKGLLLVALATVLSSCGESDDPAAPPASLDAGYSPSPDAGSADAAVSRDLAVREAMPYERPPGISNVSGHAWQWKDIGVAAPDKGSVQFFPTGILASGAGTGIEGTADSFGFAHDKLTGGGELVIRLRSLQMTSPRSVAGVMMRANATEAGAASVFLGLLGDSSKGGVVIIRRTAGAVAEVLTSELGIRSGQFLRIRRQGNRFQFARSLDRISWVQLGGVDIEMPAEIVAGLAVSASRAGMAATAEIEQFRLFQFDPAAVAGGLEFEPLVATGGRATVAGSNVSITAVGDVFVTTSEPGTGLFTTVTGSQSITARIDGFSANTPRARVGLTFREGGIGRVGTGSRHALISVDAAGRVAFHRRDRTLNSDAFAFREGLKPPIWLRLSRWDDPVAVRTRVRGSYSTDGQSWTVLDTTEMPLPDPVLLGLLYTSSDPRTHGTVTASSLFVGPNTTPIEAPADAGASPNDGGARDGGIDAGSGDAGVGQ